MNCQEVNGIPYLDTEIKVETFEEPFSSAESIHAHIIFKGSSNEENASLIKQEPAVFMKEENAAAHQPHDSQLDKIGIKDEYIDASQSIIHEEVHIKNEGLADGQPTISKFDEKDINDDYFDKPQFATHKDIDMKTEKTVRLNDLQGNLASADQFKWMCTICKSICSKDNFTGHIRLHHSRLLFACIECDKNFFKITHLDDHIVSSHPYNEQLMNSVKSPVHQCDSCDYKTVKRADLNRHVVSCIFNIPKRLDLV